MRKSFSRMAAFVAAGAFVSFPLCAGAQSADGNASEPGPAAVMFGKKCGGCHSLGEGDRAGPDLLGVTKRRDPKWIATFIRGPGAVIDSGDSVAAELVAKFKGARMPDQDLSDADLTSLLAYIDECTAKNGCKLATTKAKPAREAGPLDIAQGKDLFEGRKPLTNGGAPCLSCHNVRGTGILGGGTMAVDLTQAYARLGEQGTDSALASTPFPLMKEIYVQKPLTSAEAFQLKAYLYSVSLDATPEAPDRNFLYLGVLGAAVSFGAIGAAWRKRMNPVRKALVKGGRS